MYFCGLVMVCVRRSVSVREMNSLSPSAREAREVCHNAVCVSDCLTCVDSPSVTGGEPFARGFRSVGARLEEDAYLGAFGEVEVAGCVAFEGGADTLGESLLRLHYDVAVALNGCLIVGLRRALFLF